jgi:hypothetical protein
VGRDRNVLALFDDVKVTFHDKTGFSCTSCFGLVDAVKMPFNNPSGYPRTDVTIL